MRPILSICIPSFNRPERIVDLLRSVDCDPVRVEIVICEDKAPQREQVRAAVAKFASTGHYRVRYFENDVNLGYDGNLRRLVELAEGHYVMFMGDDDLFISGALDQYLEFLHRHEGVRFVLRSHIVIHPGGRVERFSYLPATIALPAGEASVAWLFKRCVTICGFTISREDAFRVATTDLDGTLLYQVYLMAQVCLEHESIYCDIPIVQAVQSFREDNPNFGHAESERTRYTPGRISSDNSINFTKAYFELTKHLDKKHGTQLTQRVRIILSRFSYPFLSIQRKRGVPEFLRYAKRLETECGFGCTTQYYLYKWGLVLFGEYLCDQLIITIKNVIGHTPSFGAPPRRDSSHSIGLS